MAGVLGGYARCSIDAQDLTAQRNALIARGVKPNRLSVDHGVTGTNRVRLGLREAFGACRAGDMLAVTKFDRLARSLTDVRDTVAELTDAGVKCNIGGAVHDPTGSVGGCGSNCMHKVTELISPELRDYIAATSTVRAIFDRRPS